MKLVVFLSLILLCISNTTGGVFLPDFSGDSPSPVWTLASKKMHSVRPSKIVSALVKKKSQNPNISGESLARFGNQLIRTQGANFTFSWEPRGERNRTNLKKTDFNTLLPFFYTFTKENGSRSEFRLFNRSFAHPCYSTIDIPISKVNNEYMAIIAEGRQFALKRPKDFYLETVSLVDKRWEKTFRTWKVPIDATPTGISADARRIYIEINLDELGNEERPDLSIAIEISDTGGIRFVSRKKIISGKVGDLVYDKKTSEMSFQKYLIGNKSFILKFASPCT